MTVRDSMLVVLTTLIWGGNFVVIKWGVQDMSPAIMTVLRFALVSMPLIFFVKRPKTPLFVVVGFGLTFGCGVWGVVNIAISLGVPAGQASLLLQSSAFMTIIAGVILFAEELSIEKGIGILLAFFGFILIAGKSLEGHSGNAIGLIILAGFFWTICNIVLRCYQPPELVGFVVWSSIFVPVPLLIYLGLGTSELTSGFEVFGWRGMASVIFQSVLATILGLVIWARMIAKYGLATISPFSLLVPVSGFFFAWLFFGETAETIEMIGSVMVLLGLAAISGIRQVFPMDANGRRH